MHQKRANQRCYEALCEVIPGGVNSPARAWQGLDMTPMVAERGIGDSIIDVEGQSFIDYCGSWGALIHGHANREILDRVKARIDRGTSFGITTEIEEKLARKVVELVDSVDKVRFVSSGTEATMSATRLARGFTKREIVIKFDGNYHGHADFFLVKAGSSVTELSSTSSSEGIPKAVVQHMFSLPYNDRDAVREVFAVHGEKIAAVILEPIAGNMGVVPGKREWLEFLREVTEKVGALLIFDEVISGFRVGPQGAQGLYGIRPDLTCFGKIIGGGFPVAAFGGRRDVMDALAPLGSVFQAGTLSGNPVAMEAGLAALTLLDKPGFYEALEEKTKSLTEPVHKFLQKSGQKACLQQVGSLFTLFFGVEKVESGEDVKQIDKERFGEFFRFMLSQGVFVPPSPYEAWFVSTAHTEKSIEKTRELILQFLKK